MSSQSLTLQDTRENLCLTPAWPQKQSYIFQVHAIKSYREPLKCFWTDGHLPVSVGKFGHGSCSGKFANAFE